MQRLIRAFVGCALVALALISEGQDRQPVRGEISLGPIRRVSVIRIPLHLVNRTGKAVVVPICGDIENVRLLCTLAVSLEQMNGPTWNRVPASSGKVVGGVPLTHFVEIGPDEQADFLFEFSKTIYNLVPGKPMRLVASTWAKSETTKTRENVIEFVSNETIGGWTSH